MKLYSILLNSTDSLLQTIQDLNDEIHGLEYKIAKYVPIDQNELRAWKRQHSILITKKHRYDETLKAANAYIIQMQIDCGY